MSDFRKSELNKTRLTGSKSADSERSLAGSGADASGQDESGDGTTAFGRDLAGCESAVSERSLAGSGTDASGQDESGDGTTAFGRDLAGCESAVSERSLAGCGADASGQDESGDGTTAFGRDLADSESAVSERSLAGSGADASGQDESGDGTTAFGRDLAGCESAVSERSLAGSGADATRLVPVVRKALTIAGSDSGGGAGIQADLKTFQELGVYGMSAVTAVTAQNTLGVHAVYPMTPDAVAAQLDAVGTDLVPDAIKTGMLASSAIIEAVADRIVVFGWRNLVIDPVMIAKGGSELLQREALRSLTELLIPLALVVTPNIPEAETLTGAVIRTIADRETAAKALVQMGAGSVVIKGGHDESTRDITVDLLFDGESFRYWESPRVDTRHTHGTGCTYSAALASGLATGLSVPEAADLAKSFVRAAIEDSLAIGSGHGPTNHWAYGRRVRGESNQ